MIYSIDPEEGKKFKEIKKKNNGIVYGFYYFLGFRCAYFFNYLGVNPNFVSILSFVFSLAGGVCFYYGENSCFNFYGGLFVFLGLLMDATDGKLARMTNKTSNLGVWYDYIFDYLRFLFLYPPIAIAIIKSNPLSYVALIAAYVSCVTILCSTILDMRFQQFSFAGDSKQKIIRSKYHLVTKQFYAVSEIEALAIIVFSFFNLMYEYLIIWSIINSSFFLITAVLYGTKINREDKKLKNNI